MSLRLYGELKSDEDVLTFVGKHRDEILADGRQRYHALMGFSPAGGARVLDYGCGWGINAIGVWDRGNTVVGIDLSQNEVDISRLVWGDRDGLEFSSAMIDEFADGEFDCVMSNQVIEHVHNVGNYISGINRVLCGGGTLVISTPCGATPRNVRRLLRRNLKAPLKELSQATVDTYDKTRDHIHSWDQFHFVRLLGSCGFELEDYAPVEGIPLPWSWKRLLGGEGYWYREKGRFRHLCNTMVFRFRKVADIVIDDNA